jgi:hypothetical protein
VQHTEKIPTTSVPDQRTFLIDSLGETGMLQTQRHDCGWKRYSQNNQTEDYILNSVEQWTVPIATAIVTHNL